MKPANFPARKLARQIAADYKTSCRFVGFSDVISAERLIRTKKKRG